MPAARACLGVANSADEPVPAFKHRSTESSSVVAIGGFPRVWFLNTARPGRARRVAIDRKGNFAQSRKEERKDRRESRTGRDACVTLGRGFWKGGTGILPVLPLPSTLLCKVSAPPRDQETFWDPCL